MSAAELLDNLNRAGATLEIMAGKPRVRGARIPAALMQSLKARRDEVLAEFERREAENLDRYGSVPPIDAAMLACGIEVPEHWKDPIMAYVLRQPRPVHAWVMARSNDYFERGIDVHACEWRACVDVVAWQRGTGGWEAASFLADLLIEDVHLE